MQVLHPVVPQKHYQLKKQRVALRELMFKNQVALVSYILTISLLGDATLYVALPLYHESFELTLFAVGLILSINRFSRLFFNAWVSRLLSRYGVKKLVLFVTVISSLTTLSYGFTLSLYVFIVSRILWGFSYSVLRLSVLSIIQSDKSGNIGRNIGLYYSIQELCPILVLLYLGLYIELLNFTLFYGVLSFLTLLSIPLSLKLNEYYPKKLSRNFFLPIINRDNLFVFFNSLFTEGIFLSTVGLLFMEQGFNAEESLLHVSYIFIFKRLCHFSLSYLNGKLYDLFKINSLILIGISVLVISILLIPYTSLWFVSILIILSHNHLSIGMSKKIVNSSETIVSLSDMSTWRDMAAASGVFFSISFFHMLDYRLIYVFFVLIFSYYFYIYRNIKLRLSL
jgi:MFS family permease